MSSLLRHRSEPYLRCSYNGRNEHDPVGAPERGLRAVKELKVSMACRAREQEEVEQGERGPVHIGNW